MAIERIAQVSTEGGPLLIGDRELARSWHGVFGDGADYRRACEALEPEAVRGVQIEVGGMATIVWDIPTGTAEVWRRATNSLILSRPWFDEDADIDRVGYRLATLPAQTVVRLGSFELKSGWLLIVWAAEDGAALINVEPADGRTLDLSVGDAAVIASLPAGQYACYRDEVSEGLSRTERCLIVAE
ncbi:MAG TPA: hypothetical protein VND96_13350 [Candidatus Micrarchaeaceae archaeon]|nr:hypothetical protein [Candidatus Micrarchaeaceae archaeon]